MQTILTGTDLSPRSDRALHRAALLARQFKAQLLVLHVVKDGQPSAMAEYERRQAAALLHGQAAHLAEIANAPPDILVETGTPFEVIVRTARERQADLVVVGAHHGRRLREVLAGTTVERVVRAGNMPVLVVDAYPNGPYRRVLVALDLSDASAQAFRAAQELGLLRSAEVSVVHAFRPHAKSMLSRTGASDDIIAGHVVNTAFEAAGDLTSFLDREGLNDDRHELVVEEGAPFAVLTDAIRRQNPDLLVIGTRKHTGLKRVFLGSVAEEILRHVECDVLTVPPAELSTATAAGGPGSQ